MAHRFSALRYFAVSAALTLLSSSADASAIAGDWLRQSDFEENKGQYAENIGFTSRFAAYSAAIGRDGSLTLSDPRTHASVHFKFIASDANRRLVPSEPAEHRSNYFIAGKQYTDVAHYARVSMPNAYPAIDIDYRIELGRLEFDFVLHPGADTRNIVLDIDAQQPKISESGDLELTAPHGQWTQHRPVAYQLRDGKRTRVECEYRLLADGRVGIAVGPHDPTSDLVVDPVVDYSSYLGGSNDDLGNAIAIGSDGSLYIAGKTSSTNFPVAAALDSALGGSSDAFVAKINPATGKLVYATYLGGTGSDYANAIAVDSSGSVYVTGYAEPKFPITSGAYQTTTSAPAGFVTKLSPAGNAMTYSSLLLGTTPLAIAVDSQGRAAVTGKALSTAFVTSAGAFQTSFRSAFVTVMNAAGSGVVFSTYLGGGNVNVGNGVAFDAAGKVVVAGYTEATDFPILGAFQSTLTGTEAGFVAALNSDGKSLAYSTYLGGSGFDTINGMSLDPFGNIVVAGTASSDDFPTLNARLKRAMLSNTGSLNKAYVAKIGVSPLRLIFSTFVGSTTTCCEQTYGVTTDSVGDIYVLARENSGSAPYVPMLHPILTWSRVSAKAGANPPNDVHIVTGLSRDGQNLLYQTLVSACGNAISCSSGGIAAKQAGYVAAIAETTASYQPISAINTQAALGNTADYVYHDAVVTTLALEPPSLDISTNIASPSANSSVTLTATSYGATTGTVSFLDGATVIGTASMSQGIATASASFTPGVHKIKATLGSTSSSTLLLPVTLPTP